jgi:hypothetical protein
MVVSLPGFRGFFGNFTSAQGQLVSTLLKISGSVPEFLQVKTTLLLSAFPTLNVPASASSSLKVRRGCATAVRVKNHRMYIRKLLFLIIFLIYTAKILLFLQSAEFQLVFFKFLFHRRYVEDGRKYTKNMSSLGISLEQVS